MRDLALMTIRDIALESPATIPVFEEYKIDYCCGGRRNLTDACRAAGVDPVILIQKLNGDLSPRTSEPSAVETMCLSDLVDHIVERHHIFTRNELDRLSELMTKVVTKHGDVHYELHDLHRVFSDLYVELVPHMQKEEMVLFPYIVELERSYGAATECAPFGTVQGPIRVMMAEHETAGELLSEMRKLSNDYTPPTGACLSYSGLFYGLHELERDLHLHIHIENNILFPRALELERRSSVPSPA